MAKSKNIKLDKIKKCVMVGNQKLLDCQNKEMDLMV